MLRYACLAICLPTILVLAGTGCTPPLQQGWASSNSTASNSTASNSTASPNSTEAPNSTAPTARMASPNATAPVDLAGPIPAFNEKKPLLFDSGYEKDNESCMVCHIDFKEEKISAVHLKEGVTCMACHGDSDTHRSDEYNIIRPDVLWGRAEMKGFCRQCHRRHKKPEKVAAFRKEWEDKRRANGRWVLEDSVCLDCHGRHAIVLAEGTFK